MATKKPPARIIPLRPSTEQGSMHELADVLAAILIDAQQRRTAPPLTMVQSNRLKKAA